MKFCTNCGTMIEENVKFCPNCGSAVEQPVRQEPVQQPEQPAQPVYQQPVYQQPVQAPIDDKYQGYPMKWYKFLVYFSLWAGVLINAISGIRMLTGANYGGNADTVYRVFPAMRTCDIICGILLLGIAVLGIITAVKLLKLAAVGPKLLTALYVVNIIVSIIYIVFALSATKGMLSLSDVLDAGTVAGLVVSVIMIIVNSIYFKKRESIFVN